MPTEITTDRLRALAETRRTDGKVLSLYVDLDPREFATPPARSSELNAVLDGAERAMRDLGDRLTHQETAALRADVEAVRRRLRGADLAGARGLAIFACGPAGLLEVLKLPRPVGAGVAIADAPRIEPLAHIGAGDPWWLVLLDRRRARLLAGTVDGIAEVWRVDDETSGRHDQGGRSQARFRRAIDKEADDHLRAVDRELRRRLRETTVSGILLGGPHETVAHFCELAHADVARCIAGRFDADVWNSSADEVLAAARGVLELEIARRDEELLAHLDAGAATDGRAACGLGEVLPALQERRVATLLVADGFTAAGVRCPQCGWLGITAGAQCPADGIVTEVARNVVAAAVEAAFAQAASVRILAADRLARHGSIAALTRF